jgi:secreted trypsin-like serine protease
MRRSLVPLLLSLGLLLGATAPALAISYGELDTQNQYSNVGALLVETDEGLFVTCSGTLIAPDIFLTAAHCVDDGAEMWVSFDPALEEPVTRQNSDTLFSGIAHAHPDFACCGSNDTFDIAVIVLDQEVKGIAPAQLPTLNLLGEMTTAELQSATFVAVGYGTVRETRKGAHQPLFFDADRRFAEQTANSLSGAWFTLSMNQATGSGGTCYGDSGGPHFLGDVVVSLTVTGDVWCKSTDKTYRLDTAVARDFLDEFVTLP